MNRCIFKIFIIMVIALSGCSMARTGSITSARAYMAKDKYNHALNELSFAENISSKIKPRIQAEISFLRAFCLEQLGRSEEAVGCYEYIVGILPSTEYALRASKRIEILLSKSTDNISPHNNNTELDE